ncbi:MAG: hypothetical protein H0W88_11555 [Parachlamydiaceae bacterium]|nr:hypothetical protein [Parachlamydiaceae bacterium]
MTARLESLRPYQKPYPKEPVERKQFIPRLNPQVLRDTIQVTGFAAVKSTSFMNNTDRDVFKNRKLFPKVIEAPKLPQIAVNDEQDPFSPEELAKQNVEDRLLRLMQPRREVLRDAPELVLEEEMDDCEVVEQSLCEKIEKLESDLQVLTIADEDQIKLILQKLNTLYLECHNRCKIHNQSRAELSALHTLGISILIIHGNACLKIKMIDKAIDDFQSIISQDNNNIIALCALLNALIEKNELMKAIDCTARILRCAEKEFDGYNNALFFLNKIIIGSSNINIKIQALYTLARHHKENRNFTLAIYAASKILKLDPKNIPAMYILIHSYMEKEEYDEAERIALYLSKIIPCDYFPLFVLGKIYLKRKFLVTSLEYFINAEKYSPGNLEVLLKIAQLNFIMSNKEKGFEYLSKIDSIFFNDVQVMLRIGKIYQDEGDYKNALSLYQRVRNFDKNNLVVLRYRGELYYLISRWTDALRDLTYYINENNRLDKEIEPDVIKMFEEVNNKLSTNKSIFDKGGKS